MDGQQIFQINVREVIRTKAPKAAKKIPGFLISAFERFICQDKLNKVISDNYGLTGVDFMEKTIRDFHITLQIEGEENLPDKNTKSIFASNHPLGGLDGICLSAFLGRKYDKRIAYLVNDILYFIKPLQNIFIPINKHGAQGREAAAALNEAFASDKQIITFPAGLCSRKTNGIIMDTEWKKMFITKSIEYERDIVPVYFEAKNSKLFYAVANIRKKLHLKFNIEMLFLPREMFGAGNSTFTVSFGKPVSWQTFDSSKTQQEWADWVKNRVYYSLKNEYTQNGRNNS
jgi:1-acyl-sn-glycerol-3-phosphate acyltransferase